MTPNNQPALPELPKPWQCETKMCPQLFTADQMHAYALESLRRAEGNAVGWYTDDRETDRSATTYDPVVAERWRKKGWPVGELFDRATYASGEGATLEEGAVVVNARTLQAVAAYYYDGPYRDGHVVARLEADAKVFPKCAATISIDECAHEWHHYVQAINRPPSGVYVGPGEVARNIAGFEYLGQMCAKCGKVEEAANTAQRVASGDEVQAFAIKVEKLLCAALGRTWTAAGISIESLVAELRSKTPPPTGEAVPFGYAREWDTDESDVGNYIFTRDKGDTEDGRTWTKLYDKPFAGSTANSCTHRSGTSPSWDYVTCNDCGSVFPGSNWGIASLKWFPSLDVARFYQKNGRMPEPAHPAAQAEGRGLDLALIAAEMDNFADVADRCQLTEGNASAAIRCWRERLLGLSSKTTAVPDDVAELVRDVAANRDPHTHCKRAIALLKALTAPADVGVGPQS